MNKIIKMLKDMKEGNNHKLARLYGENQRQPLLTFDCKLGVVSTNPNIEHDRQPRNHLSFEDGIKKLENGEEILGVPVDEIQSIGFVDWSWDMYGNPY